MFRHGNRAAFPVVQRTTSEVSDELGFYSGIQAPGLDPAEQLIRARHAHILQRVAEEMGDLIIVAIDLKFHIFYCNATVSKLFGRPQSQLLGLSIPEIHRQIGVDNARFYQVMARVAAGEVHHFVQLVPAVDGARTLESQVSLLCDDDGTPAGYLLMSRDVTRHKQADERQRLWSRVLEDVREAIMITDASNQIVSVNSSFTRITGYTESEVIGKSPSILASGRHPKEFFAAMWHELAEKGHWHGEIWDRRKDGKIYPKWMSISNVQNESGKLSHYVATFADISESKANEEKIAFLAYHDPLTRLPNRLLLKDRFEQALAYARRSGSKVGLLFLDLDRFKIVNDTLGHRAGDTLLQGIAERLRGCVRSTDTVSRQGGDEFSIVLTDVRTAEDIACVAQQILQRLDRPFQIDGQALTTSFSIGIAAYPDDGSDFDTLLKKADTAMYHAKESGRNIFHFFTESMGSHAADRVMLHHRLAQALEKKELSLHYQPQIDMQSGAIVGAEALLRWNNPELGMIAPDRFIPVAEESGLIVPIGRWVLREACQEARRWQELGFKDISVAVNVSALQFRRSDFLDDVVEALACSGLAPQHLEIELTESTLAHDVEQVKATIDQFKSMGIRFAIDDFGTGYSSLSSLKRLQVDKLKIDRSFVSDVVSGNDDAAIVRTIVQMARSLKLKTIAEGVEDIDQAEFLYQEGCDELQGYHFSRPLASEAFVALLKERSGR